jgi:hypothetical protein
MIDGDAAAPPREQLADDAGVDGTDRRPRGARMSSPLVTAFATL